MVILPKIESFFEGSHVQYDYEAFSACIKLDKIKSLTEL